MVRVRFAPSPTGYVHIGNIRTALFNWLFARHHGGKFILRIEDTDVQRSKPEYAQAIYQELRWLGLDWDEGPQVEGEYGPYLQSERTDIYRHYLDLLLKDGKAYPCYCSAEELETRRKKALAEGTAPRYDNRCRNLTSAQRKAFEDKGIVPAIRFKFEERILQMHDLIRGDVRVDTGLLGDMVIARSDGTFSFHFAVCVDDMQMRITHVIRGEDHLPNTPKHILLLEALGYPPPQYGHLPMILGKGGSVLSKREGASSIAEYRQRGVLPEALINYMALLGWSSKSGQDIISREQMIKEFDIKDVNKSPAIFDIEKLNWMCGQYIRKAEGVYLTDMAIPYLREAGLLSNEPSAEERIWLEKVVYAVRDHLVYMSEIVDHGRVFFSEPLLDTQEIKDILHTENAQKVLTAFKAVLESMPLLDEVAFKKNASDLQKTLGIKGKDFYIPLRVAITGTVHGPELLQVMPVLGKERCIKRLQKAQEI